MLAATPVTAATGASLVASDATKLGPGPMRQLFAGVTQPLVVAAPPKPPDAPHLQATVQQAVADFKAIIDPKSLNGIGWRAKTVLLPDAAGLERRGRAVASHKPLTRAFPEFARWKNGCSDAGKRLLFETTDEWVDEGACLVPGVTDVQVPGHSFEQIRDWMSCAQTCEVHTSLLCALLECLIAAGRAPVHQLADGTWATLTAVDIVNNRSQLAFSGLMYARDGGETMCFAPLETLCKATGKTNHRFLRLHLRAQGADGKHSNHQLWCDPTARQVFSDLPLTGADGGPLHALFWPSGQLPSEYTANGPPRLIKVAQVLRTMPGVGGKCCLPLAVHVIDSMPMSPFGPVDAVERTRASVVAVFDKTVPDTLNWAAAVRAAQTHQWSGEPTTCYDGYVKV